MDDKNKNPEDEATGNEVESPVDGPTPDWMRLAASSGTSGSSLTDENTPAWLKSIRAGQGRSQEEPTKPATPPAAVSPPPAQASDDSMSDLERLLAEEGIDLGAVAEERPEGSGDMSARDWLIATSSEEMIRNKVGAEPEPIEEQPTTPPAAVSPPPAQASDDSMSDLERLLAEEGIDLGAVAEERPEGSGDMSARDWLIATSSEEMIRNKVGAEPEPIEETAPASPQPVSAVASDDKMVVEEDLPDWLQEMADDSTEVPAPTMGHAAPTSSNEDKMVVTDDLPDWLQEIADEPSETEESEPTLPHFDQAPAPSSPNSHDEDKMVVEEDLPDWLREVEDTPSAAPTPPDEDFVASPPPERAVFSSSSEDKMVVTEDLPDWLQEIADEPEAALTEVAESPAHSRPTPPLSNEDKMVATEDLPDWLQEIADEPAVTSDWEPELSAETTSTSTVTTLTSASDNQMMAEEELPDWLRESGDESEAAALSLSPSTNADKMVVAEDLPDWLREIEIDSAESELALDPDRDRVLSDFDEDDSDEDLPDWLREVEVSSLEDKLFMPPAETPRDAPDEQTPVPLAMSSEAELGLLDDDEDLPGWLKEVQERDGKEMTEPLSTMLAPSSASVEIVDEGLPDWLKEVQDEPSLPAYEAIESSPEIEPLDEGVVEDELPDWLREAQVDADEAFEPSEPSPEPLAEAIVAEDLVIEDELPDWLQEAQDELPEGVSLEAETTPPLPTAVRASLSTDAMIDEEGLPDWLREASEEEAEPSLAEELLATPEPLPAFNEASDSFAAILAEETLEAVEAAEVTPPTPPKPEALPVSQPAVTATPSSGIPDWLHKLRQVEEEEPAAIPVASVPPPVLAPATKPAPQPAYAQTMVAPPPDIPADAPERLKLARTARDKGDITEAVRIYDSLVANGVYLDKIIEDMQQTIKGQPGNYLLFQLMGDAMLRDGRVQSALAAYREALSKL